MSIPDEPPRVTPVSMSGNTYNLDLRVISEGVETKEQIACPREKGCGEIQGYFSIPCGAEEFAALHRNGRKLI